ncbi:MAG: hypothetical protein J2P31_09495, partial [Blastocatellia bacterium]|nr:hypothetical protein [Blastocatellia bacterium]
MKDERDSPHKSPNDKGRLLPPAKIAKNFFLLLLPLFALFTSHKNQVDALQKHEELYRLNNLG